MIRRVHLAPVGKRDGRADGDEDNFERETAMQIVVGPVLTRKGGYSFDCWTPEKGLSRGYAYCRIEDAHYARNVEIRSRKKGCSDHMIDCNTVDEFVRLTI